MNSHSLKISIALLLSVGIFTSCKNTEDSDNVFNFYNLEYRIGQWISPIVENDTLEFVSASVFIRKNLNAKQEYLYRIEDKVLITRISNSEYEYNHPILKVKNDVVVIENMYGGVGFFDSSGTYKKNNTNR